MSGRWLASLLLLAAPLLAQEPPAPAWVRVFEDLEVYGDFRLRHESTLEVPGQPDRHRQRLRLRLGANYAIDDELLLGARLVTGSRTDPRSPHATLGDGLDGLEVSLDRAFLTFRPEAIPGTWITAGKFAHPLQRNPVYGELVWDADVQPEGLAAGATLNGLFGLDRVGATLGGYSLSEQAAGAEALLGVAEVWGRHRLGDGPEASLALGCYGYGNPAPGPNRLLLGDNAGNLTVDRDGNGSADGFASDFVVFNPIAAVTWGGETPLTLSAEWIHNARAAGPDSGWAVGAAFGRSEKAGQWRVYYQWQVVEREALFSPLAQDDFVRATDHQSHLFGVNRQLTDATGLHLWGLVSRPEAGGDDEDRWRLRLDLNVKF